MLGCAAQAARSLADPSVRTRSPRRLHVTVPSRRRAPGPCPATAQPGHARAQTPSAGLTVHPALHRHHQGNSARKGCSVLMSDRSDARDCYACEDYEKPGGRLTLLLPGSTYFSKAIPCPQSRDLVHSPGAGGRLRHWPPPSPPLLPGTVAPEPHPAPPPTPPPLAPWQTTHMGRTAAPSAATRTWTLPTFGGPKWCRRASSPPPSPTRPSSISRTTFTTRRRREAPAALAAALGGASSAAPALGGGSLLKQPPLDAEGCRPHKTAPACASSSAGRLPQHSGIWAVYF